MTHFSFTVDPEKIKSLPPAKRDRIVGVLREIDYLREHNPLAFYFPHEKQHILHKMGGVPVRCFYGGNQSGKTTFGLADNLIQALDEEDLPQHLRPYKYHRGAFLCRIMAPSFPVLETTLYVKLREMVPAHTLMGGSWQSAFDAVTRVLNFKNGSQFFFQTYMMDPKMMGGATLDRVHYDEEPPWAVREECRIRVLARGGDELFTLTPVEGLTWSYDEIWMKRGKEIEESVFVRPDSAIVQVDMDDNPALGKKEIELALEGLPRDLRAARKSGKFVAIHGLVYDSFRKERHVIPQVTELPPNVNVVVGIDPGIRNAAAVVWAYVTPDDDMVVFEEGYYEGETAATVSQNIHHINTLYGIKPLYYVIDPAARNKAHQTGRSDQMEYADHGIVAIAGQHEVPAGINRVKERIEADKMHITANCRHLIDEITKYRWKKPPRTGEDGPQKPVKKDDHLMDALRYVVMSRPYLPARPDGSDGETELEKMMREDMDPHSKSKNPPTEFGGIFY